MAAQCPSITLHNGVEMPQIGLGTWEARGEQATQNVRWAVSAGYRHIDCAHHYENEESVGEGMRTSGVPRSELFVTTKLWNYDHGYDNALAAFERSRQALGVDYVDLYLVHWPGQTRSYIETWRALEKLYAEKKVRAIGVSNFQTHHLDDLLANCTVRPMVNQIEMHVLFHETELRKYCAEQNIAVTAWRPLGMGEHLSDPRLVKLAEKHKKQPSQVVMRWFLQLGVITIPKSSHEERIKENFDVFDFELPQEDMDVIASMDENKRIGEDPETFFSVARD